MNLSSVIHTRQCGHSTDCLFRICNASAVHISIDLQCIYETFTFANWSPQTKGDFLKRRCLHHPVFVLPEKQSRDLAHRLRILFLDVFFPAEVKRALAQNLDQTAVVEDFQVHCSEIDWMIAFMSCKNSSFWGWEPAVESFKLEFGSADRLRYSLHWCWSDCAGQRCWAGLTLVVTSRNKGLVRPSLKDNIDE